MTETAATIGAAAAFLVVAIAAAIARRGPVMRLSDRVAPYRSGRAGIRRIAVGAVWEPARPFGARVWRRQGPPVDGGMEPPSPRGLARRLRDAGLDEHRADELRARHVALAGLMAVAGLALGGVGLGSPVWMLVLGACGAAVGSTRGPARLARLADERRRRMRLELITIDQVLAIHVRAGAGPVQAVARVVDRGQGIMVDELRAVLAAIRAGRSEADAFRYAARTTPEPHAARTYRLFALAAEQGADLGAALRALSDDLRDVRREELRRQATRRRAAMLVPMIAVLAPIMLLFVIAPLPTIVLGGR